MKKIICWGAGKRAEESIAQLEKLQYEIIGFCDMDERKKGTYFHNFPIFSLEELKQKIDIIDGIIVTTLRESVIDDICNNALEEYVIGFWDCKKERLSDYEELCSKMHFSQLGEDVYLKHIFECRGQDNVTYVDVGAYHPYKFSNTQWAYLKNKMIDGGGIGVNIEPNVEAFKLFERFRPNDININCGVSDAEGTLDYYICDGGAMNTFNYDEIRDKKRIQEVREVRVRRLDSILEQYGIKHIDFMDIDVEGYEMNVLRSIDFDAVDIEYILLEHLECGSLLSVLESDKYKFLKSKGYEAVSKYDITVMYRKMRR